LIFLLLLGLNRASCGKPWFKQVSVLICVLTVVMTFLGVFLYAKVLNIGYSFIIWAGFCIWTLLGGIFTILPNAGTKGRYLPVGCMTLGLILGIVALATPDWYSFVNDNQTPNSRVVQTTNAGVKAYSFQQQTYDPTGTNVVDTQTITSSFGSSTFQESDVTATQSTTNTITKCGGGPANQQCYDATALEVGIFQNFITGGNQVLGCGIPALFCCVGGLVAMGFILKGSSDRRTKGGAIGAAFVASALGFLGLFLYASHTSVGASFIIYAAAGFMWVMAACMAFGLLGSGGGEGGGGGSSSAPKKETPPPKDTSNTTAEV